MASLLMGFDVPTSKLPLMHILSIATVTKVITIEFYIIHLQQFTCGLDKTSPYIRLVDL